MRAASRWWGERSTSVDLFVFPPQWPTRARHGWVEAIRKGWMGPGSWLVVREGEGIGGSGLVEANAKRRCEAGAEDRVPGC